MEYNTQRRCLLPTSTLSLLEVLTKAFDLYCFHHVWFRWEHVGSTSIPGMPGTKMPDALLLIPEFPPSRAVISALLKTGYYFGSLAPLDTKDLWWFRNITDGTTSDICRYKMLQCIICVGFLKDYKLVVHCVTEDNVGGKILLETRDMCKTEEWAFNDYKEAKMSAYKGADGQFLKYKMGKGMTSKLLTMLREKHQATTMTAPPKHILESFKL